MTTPTGLRLLVVGDPIAHSLSPAIHTAALAAVGLEGTYEAQRVDGPGLEDVMDRLRRGDLDGVNVTMPHKGAAARLVDELSPEAQRSGSVNTVERDDSRLIGRSTDVTALRRLWRRHEIPTDRPVLLLGAGGAAAAAAVAIEHPSIYGSARRPEAVADLAARVHVEMVALPWGSAVADAVVVNTTPLGMGGESLPGSIVDLAAAMVDLAYGEDPTPAVSRAKEIGIPVIDGLDVLVVQAADSFRAWTGRDAPEDVMARAAANRSSRGPETPNH